MQCILLNHPTVGISTYSTDFTIMLPSKFSLCCIVLIVLVCGVNPPYFMLLLSLKSVHPM